MGQPGRFQFDRAMDEFAAWRAVEAEARSPAPAWWWDTAMSMRDDRRPMPEAYCRTLGLSAGSSFAAAAALLMAALADQTAPTDPRDFPRKREPDEPDRLAAE